MGDARSVFFVTGLFLAILALAMGVPALVDAAAGEDDWRAFAKGALITATFAGMLVLANRAPIDSFGRRQGFLLTVASWSLVSFFGSLPFHFSRLHLSYTDAFFEAISGLTTTGATVLSGLDTLPPGLLLWRAMMQWLGGIGIIVMAVALLPFLRVGGMQLFQAESSDRSEKIMPRIAQFASRVTIAYVTLSAACAFAYAAAGMTWFEAVNHAMTTLSTGGYSTSDASIAHFESAAIEWIAIAFMLAGALPYVLYVRFAQGHPAALWRDRQVRTFLAFATGASLAMTAWLYVAADLPFFAALRASAFNVTSVITTTGYASTDYGLWGAFAVSMFFFLIVVGGCTGSTAGGIKIFRFEVLMFAARGQFLRLIAPHRVQTYRYQDNVLTEDVFTSVAGYFFLFLASIAFLALSLGALGMDFVTSVSGAATALANVGPGLGAIIGPAGNFASLPDAAKWVLAFGMLLGRLELFSVLVLLSPGFWRQ